MCQAPLGIEVTLNPGAVPKKEPERALSSRIEGCREGTMMG